MSDTETEAKITRIIAELEKRNVIKKCPCGCSNWEGPNFSFMVDTYELRDLTRAYLEAVREVEKP